jgi:hypothetical protein
MVAIRIETAPATAAQWRAWRLLWFRLLEPGPADETTPKNSNVVPTRNQGGVKT